MSERLFEVVTERPTGLVFERELVPPEQESRLLERLRALDLRPVVMRGRPSHRRVRHFGLSYDYGTRRVARGESLPAWLEDVRARCAVLVGEEPDALAQTLVTEYRAGAAIGWHRDAAPFGIVLGVSLGSSCEMRFRQGTAGRTAFVLPLPPRSAYALTGEARTSWQHSIPAVRAERWSITFRTLRETRSPTAVSWARGLQ